MNQIEINLEKVKQLSQQIKAFHFRPSSFPVETITFGVLYDTYLEKYLISGSCDKTIKVWNHTRSVNCLENIPEDLFISGSDDRTIKLWHQEDGVCVKTFTESPYAILSLKKLTDNTFASGSKKEIRVWTIDDGICIKTLNGHTSNINCLITLNDDCLVNCTSDKTIKLWE